jgi:hypothetical protein
MPIAYDIQPSQGAVFVTYEDRVTEPEYHTAWLRLYTDPRYRPGLGELVDCRPVSEFAVTPDALRNIAEMSLLAAGDPPARAKVAIVVADEALEKVSRSYRAMQEATSEMVAVFRDLTDAQRWLGLAPNCLA